MSRRSGDIAADALLALVAVVLVCLLLVLGYVGVGALVVQFGANAVVLVMAFLAVWGLAFLLIRGEL